MKGDPNDLLELAYLEGSFQIIASDAVKLVPARDWKGQVPKNVMKPRIQRSLNERERTTVRDAIKGLNASGIGLHHYGRLR